MEKLKEERQEKEAMWDQPRFKEVYENTLATLAGYERKYGMTSGDFILAFEQGDLPEEEDFFRWRVIYVGYRNLLKNWAWEQHLWKNLSLGWRKTGASGGTGA